MRIYTKTGDYGQTGIGTGERVLKSSAIINALGHIDELNSFIGLYISQYKAKHSLITHSGNDILTLLTMIQNDLFDLGADLCMSHENEMCISLFKNHHDRVKHLEYKIDTYAKDLAPLKTFILPGGCADSALFHCIRTIARRAERGVCILIDGSSDSDFKPFITYLNRLSDLFFILARHVNHNGKDDVKWTPYKENQ